jgi:hypothetical protein
MNPMILFFLRRLVFCLLLGSLGGLLLCRLIDVYFFRDGNHLEQTAAGLWILRFLAIVFAGTAMILVPLQVILSRSEVKEVRKLWAEGRINPEELPFLQKHLFYSNYADVPKWVYLPFTIVLAVLVGFFALGVMVWGIIGLLWVIFHFFHLLSRIL